MATELLNWDTAEHLKTRDDVAAYLEAVFEDGDPALVAYALDVIARAEGATEVVPQTGTCIRNGGRPVR